jgi:hypothetical protein
LITRYGDVGVKLEQITKWRTKSKWAPSMNFPYLSLFSCNSIETWNLERKS